MCTVTPEEFTEETRPFFELPPRHDTRRNPLTNERRSFKLIPLPGSRPNIAPRSWKDSHALQLVVWYLVAFWGASRLVLHQRHIFLALFVSLWHQIRHRGFLYQLIVLNHIAPKNKPNWTFRPLELNSHLPLDKLAAILADDNFKCIFLNENDRIPIRISLKFVPRSPIDNKSALVQVMAWHWTGDNQLP